MDCRAASTDLFIDYFVEIDLSAVLAELGATLTLVMPVNHESDKTASQANFGVRYPERWLQTSPRRL